MTDADTVQAQVAAALRMNGWELLFAQWWGSYNPGADEDVSGRAVTAYVESMASDIAEALVNGHYPDGVCPRPDAPPTQIDDGSREAT